MRCFKVKHTMGKFTRPQIDNIFHIFPKNRICYFMQIMS